MLKLLSIFSIFVATFANPMYNINQFEGDIAGVDINQVKALGHVPDSSYTHWPNGVVYYVIRSSSNYTQPELNAITNGMRAIENQTKNCISFVLRTNQATYLEIHRGSGCWSYVGMQRRIGAQLLSIGNGCAYNMIVAHELMHALGIWHEQSRPDRDTYVKINYANIQNGTEHNFNMYTTGVTLTTTNYDIKSIMHYEWNAFSKNGLATVESLDPLFPTRNLTNASQKLNLTNGDAEGIMTLYNCPKK